MATNHGQPARGIGRSADHLCRWRAGSSGDLGGWCLSQWWDLPCGGSGGESIEGIHGRGEDELELWKKSEGKRMSLGVYKG
jgi:hypothetical protein